ncbi:MAG: DNA methyltransferase [Chloroflexota bacterium]
MARKIYHITPESKRDEKKKQLASILSVSERTIRDWLSRIDKDSKVARNRRIFDLWLACYTQEEIAKETDVSKMEVSRICNEMADLPESYKPAASHLTDFDPPIYNVWKQQEKTSGSSHFGNSEVRWVDNLLYLYTQPFDVVVDPFAGGGSTIDICKKRFRRYWASDRIPVPERAHQIREHDITTGLPPLPRWKDIKLVYLDPPYWKQAEGKYSQDKTDLSNMPLDEFTSTLAGLIKNLASKLTDSVIALILQPTQWKAPDKQYTDHVADMIKAVNLPIDLRIQCPYESQQCTPQMVDWAKTNRKLLVISREIVAWRV